MNNKRCELLPQKIGNNVIKISLDKNKNEHARVILFIPDGGYINKHSHDKSNNPDSELYIDLLKLLKSTDESTYFPEIAGSNSPTGIIEHSIEIQNYPQIILAIKKGQELNAWEDFNNDFRKFLQDLNIRIKQNENEIKIKSKADQREELITINTNTRSVTFFNGINQEFVTLDGLLKMKNPESKLKAQEEN